MSDYHEGLEEGIKIGRAEAQDRIAELEAARADALEEAARIADSHAHGSDKKFRDTIRRASAAGNTRCFDLAAACAAGMDHEARKIAAAIRALKEGRNE